MQRMQDFLAIVFEWSLSRKVFATQLETLRKRVEVEGRQKPDAVVVTGIPRHHAKKLAQQDWTKDYYVSKESRSVTATRTSIHAPISVVFSKYPTSSEQWFALGSDSVGDEQGFAHIVEICIPLNAWHPARCPLALLQEYQLTYDEVSTITLVIATVATKELKSSFNPSNVRNSVIFISTSSDGDPQNKQVEPQLRLWKRIANAPADSIVLVSTIGDIHSDPE